MITVIMVRVDFVAKIERRFRIAVQVFTKLDLSTHCSFLARVYHGDLRASFRDI